MYSKDVEKTVKWIEEKNNLKVSKFMKDVLDILSYVYNGLHHTKIYDNFKKKDWCEKNHASYVEMYRSLSTYDYSELTELVILAHLKQIRIGIRSLGEGSRRDGLKIGFSRCRNDRKHPSIFKKIEYIRKQEAKGQL
jgi:hypothetical protein